MDTIITEDYQKKVTIKDSRFLCNFLMPIPSRYTNKAGVVEEINKSYFFIQDFYDYSKTFYIEENKKYMVNNECYISVDDKNTVDFIMGLRIKKDIDIFLFNFLFGLYFYFSSLVSLSAYNFLKSSQIKLLAPYLEFHVDKNFYLYVNENNKLSISKKFKSIIKTLEDLKIEAIINENLNKEIVTNYILKKEMNKINIDVFNLFDDTNQSKIRKEIEHRFVTMDKKINEYENCFKI